MGFDADLKAPGQPQGEITHNPFQVGEPILLAQAADQEQDGPGIGGWLRRQGKKVTDGAKKIGGEVSEQVQNIDGKQIGDAAKKAINSDIGKQVIGGVTGQQSDGVIGTASRILFPQGQIIGIGGREVGGFAARKYAKQLLSDPASLALKMDGNFDLLDGNKDKYINADELKDSGGLMGLLDESRGLGPIMQRGYSTFANLDGKNPELGIGRGDVQVFKLLTNEQLREQALDGASSSGRMTWGGTGLLASLAATGGAKYFAPQLLKNIGGAKVGIAIAAITAISGLVGGAMKRSSLSSEFAEKEQELKSTFESIKATL